MLNADQAIAIARMQEHEFESLLSLYVDLFHDREPLTRCLGLSRHRLSALARAIYGGQISRLLSQELCWIAKDPAAANRAVGFLLCDDPTLGHPHELFKDLPEQEAQRIAAVIALLEELSAPVRSMFELANGEVVHVAAVGVAPGYEGQGLGRRLLHAVIRQADDRGFHFALSECTSVASRKLHEHCGFEQINSIRIGAFELNGQRPFAHCAGEVFLMRKILGANRPA